MRAKIQALASIAWPRDTPITAPSIEVNEDKKLRISAILIDKPDWMRIAKSPEKIIKISYTRIVHSTARIKTFLSINPLSINVLKAFGIQLSDPLG